MADNDTSTDDGVYTLYHAYHSICSLQTRFTWTLRGQPKDHASRMELQENELNLFKMENWSEQFLTEINPKGQVPALANAKVFPSPLTESIAITNYISGRYPSLSPESHEDEIQSLLKELHSIEFYSLTFSTSAVPPDYAQKSKDMVHRLLTQSGNSPGYQEALKQKVHLGGSKMSSLLEPQSVNKAIEQTRVLFAKIEDILTSQSGDARYLFGLADPTAIDSHIVVFVKRLQEIGRGELIPEKTSEYADKFFQSDEWIAFMAGRKTL